MKTLARGRSSRGRPTHPAKIPLIPDRLRPLQGLPPRLDHPRPSPYGGTGLLRRGQRAAAGALEYSNNPSARPA